MKTQDDKLDTPLPDTPVPVPGGDALADPAMAAWAPAAAGAGIGAMLKEEFVRGSISDEENALTRDRHVGQPVTGHLDEAVDAPDHSVNREGSHRPDHGR